MKISELVEHLQFIAKEMGDVEVRIDMGEEMGNRDIELVFSWKNPEDSTPLEVVLAPNIEEEDDE